MIVIGVEIAPEIVREIEIRVALVAAITIINAHGPIAIVTEIVTEIAIMTATATATATAIMTATVPKLKIKRQNVLHPSLIQRCRTGRVYQLPRQIRSVIRV